MCFPIQTSSDGSVRHLHAVHVLYVQYSWDRLGDPQVMCFSQEMLFPRMLAGTFPKRPLLSLAVA